MLPSEACGSIVRKRFQFSSRAVQSKASEKLSNTRTLSCVFVLFQVMSWLFSISLRTVNNTKTQENVSVCTGPKASLFVGKMLVNLQKPRVSTEQSYHKESLSFVHYEYYINMKMLILSLSISLEEHQIIALEI